MNDRETERRVGAYFAACDETRERIPLKSGGFQERQIPYTLYGLAAAAGLSVQKVLALANGGRGKKARVLRDAVLRIGAYTMERALLGELSHQVALPVLDMLSGTEKPRERIEITMDEAAERYAQ